MPFFGGGGEGITNSAANKRFAISDGTDLNGGDANTNAELDTTADTITLVAPNGVIVSGGAIASPTLLLTSSTSDDAFLRVAKSSSGIERNFSILMETPDTGVGSNITVQAGAGAAGDEDGGGLVLSGGNPTGTGTGGGVDIGGGSHGAGTGDGGDVYIHGGAGGAGGHQGIIYLDTVSQVIVGDVNSAENGTLLTVDDVTETISLVAANGVLINGIKRYVALLTQAGTDAPVATVLENTLGGTVVWSYDDVGSYTAMLSSAFPSLKTFFGFGGLEGAANSGGGNPMGAGTGLSRISNNAVHLAVTDGASNPQNNYIDGWSIEIRVYP